MAVYQIKLTTDDEILAMVTESDKSSLLIFDPMLINIIQTDQGSQMILSHYTPLNRKEPIVLKKDKVVMKTKSPPVMVQFYLNAVQCSIEENEGVSQEILTISNKLKTKLAAKKADQLMKEAAIEHCGSKLFVHSDSGYQH